MGFGMDQEGFTVGAVKRYHERNVNIPPFWSRLKRDGITATGWSFTSAADADQRAEENCAKIARQLAAEGFDARGKLYYADRPVREQIIREFRDAGDEQNAVITRNAYGSFVLNASRMLFVDVDLPKPPPPPNPLVELVKGWLGKKAEPPPDQATVEARIVNRARAWASDHAPWSWRVYRTKAGLRFLAVHSEFALDSPLVRGAFDALGADPLYRHLCTMQKCFRARLTPKAWRCNYPAVPVVWPFIDAAAETKFKEWEAGYLKTCREWRTCQLLETIGSAAADPKLAELVAVHDETTRIEADLPLA
jgi:hypothetical protein